MTDYNVKYLAIIIDDFSVIGRVEEMIDEFSPR